MKYFNTLLIVMVIILCGCEKGSCMINDPNIYQETHEDQLISENQKEILIDTINSMERRRIELFKDGIYNPEKTLFLNSEEKLGVLISYVGENDTFEKICAEMGEFCSPEVTEKLMKEINMYNINGEIYFHAAGGMPIFNEIDDPAKITLVSIDEDVFCIDIIRNYYMDKDYVVCRYSVCFDNDSAYILEYDYKDFVKVE